MMMPIQHTHTRYARPLPMDLADVVTSHESLLEKKREIGYIHSTSYSVFGRTSIADE